LRNTLLCALGVALVGRTSTLELVHLGALLQAAAHAVNGALAGLGLRGERAVATAVTLLAQAGSVVAISVLRAVVQAGADVASVARPAGVAVALTLDALAVAAAALAMSRAAGVAVLTAPAVLARADTVEARTVAGAAIANTVVPLTVARLLGAVIAGVASVANARHLGANRDAHTVARARRRAGGQSAVQASEAGLAEAGAVVAVSVAGALRAA
jgi:hypothetical protein